MSSSNILQLSGTSLEQIAGNGADRIMRFDFPNVTSNNVTFEFGRATNVPSDEAQVTIYKADGTDTPTHTLSSAGHVLLDQSKTSGVRVGSSNPPALATVSIDYDTASTSPSTGALTVTGGVGIGSALHVASTVTAPFFAGNGSLLTSLNATNISTGTLAVAQGGTGTTTSTGTGAVVLNDTPTFIGTVSAGTFSGSGSYLTSLNATNISSGTLAVAQGGTGTTTSTGTGSVVLNNAPTFTGTVNLDGILVLSSNGASLGIGTTTPLAKLHVLQTSASTPAFRVDDVVADTTPFIVTDTGNVGIGTSAPQHLLDVHGDVNLTGSLLQNGTPFIGSRWTLTTNDITYINGNVGIGTTDPGTYKLRVEGPLTATSFIGDGAALTNLNASVLATGTVSTSLLPSASTSSAGIVQLSSSTTTNDATQAATASAASNLQAQINDKLPLTGGSLSGNLTVGGDLTVSGTTTTVNSQTVTVTDNIITLNANQTGTPAVFLRSGIEVERGDASNYFFVFEESNQHFKIGLSNELQSVATRPDSVADRTIAVWDDTNKQYSYVNNVVIVSTGNLGIGTSEPASALDVNGNVTAGTFSGSGSLLTSLNATNITSGTLAIAQGGTGTTTSTGTGSVVLNTSPTITGTLAAEMLRTTGSIGIGTASPISSLHVHGSNTGTSGTFVTVTNNTSRLQLVARDTDPYLGVISNQPFHIVSSNNIRFTVASNGNIGIGSTQPITPLQVNGTITADTFSGSGSLLTSLNATNISAGTLAVAQGGTGTTTSTGTGSVVLNNAPTFTGTITAGTFSGSGSLLTSLNATNISAGTLVVAQGGTGTTTSTGTGSVVLNNAPTFTGTITADTFSGSGALLTSLNATNISTGTLAVAQGGTGTTTSTGTGSVVLNNAPTFTGTITADTFSGSGSLLTSLNATNISTGTLLVARGGTGTASSTGTGSVVLNNAPTFTGTLTAANVYASGNIGIGVTNTSARLHVNGTVKASGFSIGTEGSDNGFIGFFNTYNDWGVVAGPALVMTELDDAMSIVMRQSSSTKTHMNKIESDDGNLSLILGKFTSTANESATYTTTVYLKNDGNVGISTTNPSAKLHIVQSGTAPAFRVDDASSDTTPFIITETGNVGIGTIAPQHLLDVHGDVNLTGSLLQNGIAFIGSRWTLTGNDITYNNGNVGIGTNDPGTNKLKVDGPLTATRFIGDGASITNLNATNISAGTLAVTQGGTGTTTSTGTGSVVLNNAPTFTGTITADTFSGSGSLLTSLNATNISTGTLAVAQGGTGTTTSTGTGSVVLNTSPTITGTLAAEMLRTTGSIGIGTASPISSLHVHGSNTGTSGTFVTVTNNTSRLQLVARDTDPYLGVISNQPFHIVSSNNFRFTVASNGNVGIGNTQPITLLQVNGTITASTFSGSGSLLTSLNATNISAGTLAVTQGGTGTTTSTGTGSVVLNNTPTFTGTVTADTFSGSGALITSLNATNISTGTLTVAQGGTGTTTSTGTGSVVLNNAPTFTGTVTAGTFQGSGALLTSLNATNISTGTLLVAQGGTGTTTSTGTGSVVLNNAPAFTGIVTADTFSGNGSLLTDLNASVLATGTVSTSRLPSASTSSAGIVQLSSSTTTDDTTQAATVSAASNLQAQINDKLAITGGSLSGNLTVGGDLTVSGTTTTVNSQTVTVTDNIITLNANQTGTPASFLRSGIEVERGDSSNYFFLFEEATEHFKIGLSNELQAVATRADSVTDRTIAVWDNTSKQYSYVNNVVLSSSGNLGIGTNNPETPLVVDGTVTATTFSGSGSSLTSLNATNISTGTLLVARGGTGTTTSTGTGSVVLSANPRFTGSVGIARTDPQAAFEISPIANAANQNNGLRLSTTGSVGTTAYRYSDFRLISDNNGGFRTSFNVANDGTQSPVEALTIRLASGSVGIGTTNPVTSLHIQGASTFSSNLLKAASSTADIGTSANRFDNVYTDNLDTTTITTSGNATLGAEVFITGNVGIGTTNPVTSLHVQGASTFSSNLLKAASSTADIGTSANRFDNVYTDNLDTTTVTTSGNATLGANTFITGSVGIGTTNPEEKLHVIGDILASGEISAFSDARYKTNIHPINDALAKLQQIRGVYFTRLPSPSDVQVDISKRHLGLIAQEVEAVFPEVVHTDSSQEAKKAVAYGNLVGVLCEAVKELSTEIKDLKNRIRVLEGKQV